MRPSSCALMILGAALGGFSVKKSKISGLFPDQITYHYTSDIGSRYGPHTLSCPESCRSNVGDWSSSVNSGFKAGSSSNTSRPALKFGHFWQWATNAVSSITGSRLVFTKMAVFFINARRSVFIIKCGSIHSVQSAR